jgi:alkaline phosphatase
MPKVQSSATIDKNPRRGKIIRFEYTSQNDICEARCPRLNLPVDAQLTIHYGTNSVCCASAHTMEHTGTEVRVAAQGPQAFRILGAHDMTEMFHVMARAMEAE